MPYNAVFLTIPTMLKFSIGNCDQTCAVNLFFLQWKWNFEKNILTLGINYFFCHQGKCQSWVKIARGNNLNFWKWQNKVSIWYFVTCLQYQSVQSGFLGLYKSKICYKHLAQLIPPLIHTMKSFWKRMCLSNKNIF